MTAALIILGIIVVFFILVYNSLIGKKNQVEYAFGGMDVQMKKRYDLIPNLVSTVKNYLEHERELLEEITKLRSQALETPPGETNKSIELENMISKALGKLQVAVENYPDLKANQNFMDLQRSLNEVESQIAASRRTYNAAVTDFNNGIEMFPGNLLAGFMKLKGQKVFDIPEEQRENVNVQKLF